MRLTRAALVAAALLAAACGGGADGADRTAEAGNRSPADGERPAVENFAQPAHVVVEAEGAATTTFEGGTELNVLRADVPGGERLVTVGILSPVEGEHGWRIHEVYVNVIDYTGEGEYEVAATGQSGGSERLANNAYAVITRGEVGDLEGGRFDQAVEPCTIRLEREGLEGEMRCPALADADGRTVSLLMRWDGDGPSRNLMPDPGTSADAAAGSGGQAGG